MEEKPSYYAVIPANVRYDENLRANAKLMYGEITALSSKYGECTASNNYFAKLYGVDASSISKWITQLKEKEYITVDYETNGKEIAKRVIKIIGIDKYQYVLPKDNGGYCQKAKENNTSINNTSKKEIYKERFKKPTLEEVQNYCNERNNGVNPQRFIDFYESKDWYIGKNKMKDWKACVRTWERNKKEAEVPGWFNQPIEEKEIDDEKRRLVEKIRGASTNSN